eukprot:UN2303
METGKPIFEPGLLAQALRGVLYIYYVNLLQDDLLSLLLTALESGVNRVEREWPLSRATLAGHWWSPHGIPRRVSCGLTSLTA